MRAAASVKSVPWETAEKSNGMEKGRRLLLFQSVSCSQLFTSSVPHSLTEATQSLINSLATWFSHSPTHSPIHKYVHHILSFRRSSLHQFTLYHTKPPSLTFSHPHPEIHSLIFFHSATPWTIRSTTPFLYPLTHLTLPLLHSHLHPAVITLPHSLPFSTDHLALLPSFTRWHI
jgi:hypothetical protein